jgi:hypothetical protein
MKTKTIIYCFANLIFFNACWSGNPGSERSEPARFKKLNQLEWLLGSWANLSDEGNFYENWARTNDSVFTAFSYMTISGDTVFSESVTLEMLGNDLLYIVSVADQNDAKPVSFKLVSSNKGEFVFENKEHDFPQRIIYKNPTPDSLHAMIEGMINGKFSRQDFPMKRIQQ